MAIQSEKNIKRKRTRSGILLPLLEDLMTRPVRVEDEEDINFISDLLRKAMEREKTRGDSPMFSPSALASCLRRVYLTRHSESLGIQRLGSTRIEPNFYFLTGEWLHYKWQFVCWKLHRTLPDKIFKLLAVELPVISKHGDHGGTSDVIAEIYKEPFIIDYKGLNVRDFGNITRGGASGYEIQLSDYMILNNVSKNGIPRIKRALLMTENKGGPDNNHPIALHETEIILDDYLAVVRHRMGVLREHESKEEIPEPECTSTGTFQFQGCPFRGFCRKEVKQIEERRRIAEGRASNYKVARPSASKKKRRR